MKLQLYIMGIRAIFYVEVKVIWVEEKIYEGQLEIKERVERVGKIRDTSGTSHDRPSKAFSAIT